MSRDLELAKGVLREQGLRLVAIKDGRVLASGRREGLADLLAIAEERGQALAGAALADTVVGKAAAMLARLVGIAEVYAQLASSAAAEELGRAGIGLEYDRLVEHILARDGASLCPFEAIAQEHQDPRQAVEAFKRCLRELAGGRKG